MSTSQPVITSSQGRSFSCSATGLVVCIINAASRVLLLSHPSAPDTWEMPSGALESGETLQSGVLREAREELGPHAVLRPLGTVHAYTYHFDPQVMYMISLVYLLAFEGGEVVPGDDVSEYQHRWWSVEALADPSVLLRVPRGQKWIVERGVELHRSWSERPEPTRHDLDPHGA